MIILDTNIISELMRPSPSPKVITWIDEQHTSTLFITSITVAEIRYGLNVLPKGQRRGSLEDAFERTIQTGFFHRVLDFDLSAANVYGPLMASRRSRGQPLSISDGQIASIALVFGSKLATRNLRDFEDSGIELIDPFTT